MPIRLDLDPLQYTGKMFFFLNHGYFYGEEKSCTMALLNLPSRDGLGFSPRSAEKHRILVIFSLSILIITATKTISKQIAKVV
jgi:hypothetical protein